MTKDEGYYGPMLDDYEKRIAMLEAALRPFAARVFNDNGAVTYSTEALDAEDLYRAWRALHRS